MRGLTQIRSATRFPAVAALRNLAADVREILGENTKIGYAADWSEYFGYHPQDGSGDVYFHLDPLWADSNIDFVGIDNYMPLSDWRDGRDHLDAQIWTSVHDPEYLRANIEDGEGYSWFYPSAPAREAQRRVEISDGAHGEPWVFRYKDIRAWWANAHHERVGGVRAATPTGWTPQSKPIWFTEIGCAAVDKGTNQPNVFFDARSSESALPHFSNGGRDDALQQAYIQAMHTYWTKAENNPVSALYNGPMIDTDRMFVWAWDTRPFPFFPNNRALWSDGRNHGSGHWINGRSGNRTLASIVEEICLAAGLENYNVLGLRGIVRGFVETEVSDARSALQPLMLRYGFDALERDGEMIFAMRGDKTDVSLEAEELAVSDELEGDLERQRAPDAEISGRVRLSFVEAERDFEALSEEAILPGEESLAVTQSDMPLSMTRVEGRQTVERWLAEARVARDSVRLSLPPSRMHIGVGDTLSLQTDGEFEGDGSFRIDRVTQSGAQVIEATRQEDSVYKASPLPEETPRSIPFVAPVPVLSLFLDLPLLRGDEVPHAPHVAVTARPWPGSVAVYAADGDEDYELNNLVSLPAVIGVTESLLGSAPMGRFERGAPLQVRMLNGELESVSDTRLLNGGNLFAIGDGTPDNWELLQFQNADVLDANRYLVSKRLRGQLGSEVAPSHVWPAGSWVVGISDAVTQLDLTSALRNVARHYRIGPAGRALSDPTYTHHIQSFSGIGLRPYAPVHLQAKATVAGGIAVHWTRRTRVDGDGWDVADPPVGEDSEAYLVRVRRGVQVLREAQVSQPIWLYGASEMVADGVEAGDVVDVAQISARFGPGKFATFDPGF